MATDANMLVDTLSAQRRGCEEMTACCTAPSIRLPSASLVRDSEGWWVMTRRGETAGMGRASAQRATRVGGGCGVDTFDVRATASLVVWRP